MLLKRGKTWHSRIMFDGRTYQQSLRTKNQNEALKLEAVFRSSLVRGEFGIIDSRKSPTLAEFEVRLLPHLKSSVAPRTYDFYCHYLNALKRFPTIAQARLHQIDESMIERFVQHRLKQDGGRSVMTVNHSLRTLRRALILAKDWKLLRDVPKIKLLPGEHERDYVLSDAVLKRMTDYIARAYPTSLMRVLLPFLVDTGLRIGEACNLQIDQVQRSTKPWSIKIIKGKTKYAKREIPLTARAASCIEQAFKQSRCSYVWTAKGGRKALGRHYPSQQFRVIRDAIGLPSDCVLHSTRHTFCTRLGNAGADAFTIQRLAGHSSIVISQRYVHSDRSVKESAIRLLDAMNQPKTIQPSDTIEEI